MSLNYKTISILLLCFLSILISNKTSALSGPEEITELEEKIYYKTTPEKPNIGDEVQIEAQMYGTNIADTNFSWKINNKTFKEGVGLNKISFTLSEKTNVNLKILTSYGSNIEKSFTFDPKKVVIIWESKTYTPPFYKGKSMYTPESSLVLNAINLDQDNPLTNTYNNYLWSVDGTVKGNDSGVGYSTYVYQGDILKREPLFSVTVSGINSYKDRQNNKNSNFNNEALLRVQTLNTEIISYEKYPLLGVMFNKTIKNQFNMNKNEATIVSYPMYYGISSVLSGVYNWTINDVNINNTSNELSFRKKKDNEQSRLSLKIKNLQSILQTRDVLYIINTKK